MLSTNQRGLAWTTRLRMRTRQTNAIARSAQLWLMLPPERPGVNATIWVESTCASDGLCILAALFLAAVLNHGFPVIFHCFLLRIKLDLLWCHEFFLAFYMHTLSPTTQLKSLIRVVPVTANACEHVVMEL